MAWSGRSGSGSVALLGIIAQTALPARWPRQRDGTAGRRHHSAGDACLCDDLVARDRKINERELHGWVSKASRFWDQFLTICSHVLSPDALAFIAGLHRQFNDRRIELLGLRPARAAALVSGDYAALQNPDPAVREGDWQVAPAAPALNDRRTEITGPTDRKMMINALNSGAKVFMVDFEDSLSPTWWNALDGQRNVDGCGAPHDRLREPGRPQIRAQGRNRHADHPPAWLAPGRAASDRRRRADLGQPLRFRALLLPQCEGTAGPR